MRQHGPAAGLVRVFTPDIENNLTDPNPVRVHIKSPTERQRRRFRRLMSHSVVFDSATNSPITDADGNFEVRIDYSKEEQWKEAAILECVERVENYERLVGADPSVDSNWAPVATAGDLWEHGADKLIELVAAEVLESYAWREDQKKTYSEQPDSLASQGNPSGIVENAKPRGSSRSAGASDASPIPNSLM